MLRSAKQIRGYKLAATDGDIGSCEDFLFDDQQWTVRYMVADTGGWLSGRRVLISPVSLGTPDWKSSAFPVQLTKQQIEDSPSLASDAPISRQFEQQWHQHFSWPYYWQGGATWGTVPVPTQVAPVTSEQYAEQLAEIAECHLRSLGEVINYQIHASDGDIGHVKDFLVDDEDWRLRYLLIGTGNWLPGRTVMCSPDWIKEVKWGDSSVTVDMTKQGVKDSPEFDPSLPVNREYETRLYDFHGRPVYW